MRVFISHQKGDKEQAKIIADYLISVGIGVYFDEFDRELQIAHQNKNPKDVVLAIKKGIASSTHMICIVSPNTLTSEWVPFEVGYGYDATYLATLTLKGIINSDLPDYIKTKHIIRDIYDINEFIKSQSKDSQILLERKLFSHYSSSNHPLSGIMDTIISSEWR